MPRPDYNRESDKLLWAASHAAMNTEGGLVRRSIELSHAFKHFRGEPVALVHDLVFHAVQRQSNERLDVLLSDGYPGSSCSVEYKGVHGTIRDNRLLAFRRASDFADPSVEGACTEPERRYAMRMVGQVGLLQLAHGKNPDVLIAYLRNAAKLRERNPALRAQDIDLPEVEANMLTVFAAMRLASRSGRLGYIPPNLRSGRAELLRTFRRVKKLYSGE